VTRKISSLFRAGWTLAIAAIGSFLLVGSVCAADLKVLTSGGYTAAYRMVTKQVDAATGHKTTQEFGASMGASPSAIPSRLRRAEAADVVIMVGSALDDLIAAGLVLPNGRVDLAKSSIAMAVRAGASKPDIRTVESFKAALLAAKSIAYSDSASGVYLVNELFPKLGIADQLKPKLHMIAAPVMVGEPVAKGDYDLGFQQLSELRSVPGIDVVGLIPPQTQLITLYSAGVVAASKHPAEAQAVIRYLQSPAAAGVVRDTGLEPIP